MVFKLRKASDLWEKKPVIVEIKTMDDLASLQGTLIADEIIARGYSNRRELIQHYPYAYDLIVDFHNHTIVFRNDRAK